MPAPKQRKRIQKPEIRLPQRKNWGSRNESGRVGTRREKLAKKEKPAKKTESEKERIETKVVLVVERLTLKI